MSVIDKAERIAIKDLRACYGKEGIFAGLRQFKDYWARDSFFASLGSLAIKDNEIVKKNLTLFLNNVNSEGQIPLRIGKGKLGIISSYFGLAKDFGRKPIYLNDTSQKKPKDQNSLFIIALYEYLQKTRDYSFAKENKHRIEQIAMWNLNHTDKDILIQEEEYCNWMDSIKKKGKVLYTNVCHCYALECLSKIFEKINKREEEKYKRLHLKVKKKINELFWQGEHYIDWIDNKKTNSFFSTDGNVLAILWNIADREKSRHIEEASHIFDINEIPSQCVHPNYPNNLISARVKLIGLRDYHNGLSWLWLGCINALAKKKIGMLKEARQLLERIAELIVKYNHVYEVYEKTGKPVKRLIYRAEHPFAWSAGLFLYAKKLILKE